MARIKEMKQLNLLLLVLMTLFSVSSCKPDFSEISGEPVVKVHNEFLFKRDIEKILPPDYTPADSAIKAENYIDMWVKKQVALEKAEQELTKEEMDVAQQLADYRAKLLIHKYKQKYIANNLDTSVTTKDIADFYQDNPHEFILNTPVIKGLFLKVPITAEETEEFTRRYVSDDIADSLYVEDYVYRYAETFDHYRRGWMYFQEIRMQLPQNTGTTRQFLQRHNHYETSDSLYHYFLRIDEYRLPKERFPMIMVENNIRSILLNKRRNQLIQDLEKTLYQEAINKRDVEFYN